MAKAWHVTPFAEMRNAYRILGRKPEAKRLLWRPRLRCEDNIKIYYDSKVQLNTFTVVRLQHFTYYYSLLHTLAHMGNIIREKHTYKRRT